MGFKVGERLALWALGTVYDCDIPLSGPMYSDMTIEGKTIRLRFDHRIGGLKAKDDGALTGFAIAGEGRKFAWADANINGKTVVVSSDAVPKPVAVRYGWADNPECNLTNGSGLSASPFRTDDWPAITTGKR